MSRETCRKESTLEEITSHEGTQNRMREIIFHCKQPKAALLDLALIAYPASSATTLSSSSASCICASSSSASSASSH